MKETFLRRVAAAVILACGASLALPPRASADAVSDASRDRALLMKSFIVSATRIEKNPWRYASLPGIEVLSRASDEQTTWALDTLRRGLWLENDVIPKDWRPASPVPFTVIIDDTNLASVQAGSTNSQPIFFRPPADALTWGKFSDRTDISTDPVTSYDYDASSINANVCGVETTTLACGSAALDRLLYSTPALPRWLIAGLLGRNGGAFRESFVVFSTFQPGFSDAWMRKAKGPGTLWVSLDETRRLLKQIEGNPKTLVVMPALRTLFTNLPPSGEGLPLWESEAGLFVRWGLMGPGHDDPALSKAFLEFVGRARRAPVTEKVFLDCFGFRYADMEAKLQAFLKAVLAQPTSIDLDMPAHFEQPAFRKATADQIGRILGDWLRMKGDALRPADPELSGEFVHSAGRMLLRSYKDDNGLSPDENPEGEAVPSGPPPEGAPGSAVVMKPFVVTASKIHDPSLLAVYGLYEFDAGNYPEARELLEAAAKQGAVRPKAYMVLAELRYTEAIAKPLGSAGKISAGQAAGVLEPLKVALSYPGVSDIYRLMIETWEHCEARPTEADVHSISEGVDLYPWDIDLTYRAAFLCAHAGYPSQAEALIDKGLLFTTHESNIDYFEQLRSTLASGQASRAR